MIAALFPCPARSCYPIWEPTTYPDPMLGAALSAAALVLMLGVLLALIVVYASQRGRA
jgi:hypothetical protein